MNKYLTSSLATVLLEDLIGYLMPEGLLERRKRPKKIQKKRLFYVCWLSLGEIKPFFASISVHVVC